METFQTLKQALKTKLEPVILKIESYSHKGMERKSITVRKQKGKRTYLVFQYENGEYSDAV